MLESFLASSVMDVWQGFKTPPQSTFTCSKLTIETLEQGAKYSSKLTTKTPEGDQ